MKIFHSSYPVEIGTEGIEPSSSEYLCHKISSVQNRYTCTAPIRKEAKIMKKITLVSTAGLVGCEPTSAAVKVLCLTAWRQPCTRVARMTLPTSFDATAPIRNFLQSALVTANLGAAWNRIDDPFMLNGFPFSPNSGCQMRTSDMYKTCPHAPVLLNDRP